MSHKATVPSQAPVQSMRRRQSTGKVPPTRHQFPNKASVLSIKASVQSICLPHPMKHQRSHLKLKVALPQQAVLLLQLLHLLPYPLLLPVRPLIDVGGQVQLHALWSGNRYRQSCIGRCPNVGPHQACHDSCDRRTGVCIAKCATHKSGHAGPDTQAQTKGLGHLEARRQDICCQRQLSAQTPDKGHAKARAHTANVTLTLPSPQPAQSRWQCAPLNSATHFGNQPAVGR